MSYLRYIPDTKVGEKFAGVRYPAKKSLTREQAQTLFEQMDGYGRLEIVEEEGD